MAWIDLTASRAQPSAERARPLRQTILVDAHQCRRVVRHHSHSRLDNRAAMAFVGEVPCATTQQAGHDAFDHGSAVSTRVGEVHLGCGPYVVQVRLVQAPEDVRRRGRRGEGIDGFRDPHGEHPPLMQRLTQGSVIQRQIASERMEGRDGARPDPDDRLLHFVDQGLHRTGLTRIPHGQMQGNDTARRRLGDHPGRAAELGGAMAFALANRRNRGIIRVDDLAVGQRLAWREPAGLEFDPVMSFEGGCQLGVQARPVILRHLRRAVPLRLGGPRQRQDRLSSLQQWRLGLAHQRHKHLAHPPTLAAEAAHNLREVMLALLRLRLQGGALGGALGRYGDAELEDFFWALYRVAASLTRWLPCLLGKVSTTTCAGLTKPSSIAVAAWITNNSSINGSSR